MQIIMIYEIYNVIHTCDDSLGQITLLRGDLLDYTLLVLLPISNLCGSLSILWRKKEGGKYRGGEQ